MPLARGKEVAAQYNVERLLEPLFDYRPSGESPPLAPKHLTASSYKPKAPTKPKIPRVPRQPQVASKKQSMLMPPTANKEGPVPIAPAPKHFRSASDEDEMEDYTDASLADSASITTQTSSLSGQYEGNGVNARVGMAVSGRKRKYGDMRLHHDETNYENTGHNQKYSDILLDYFMAPDDEHFPEFLLHPPADFDVNAVIDEDGHTAFHWACALGDIRVVEALVAAGADYSRTNHRGQTGLIRSVMFTNNHDRRTFPKLVDILRASLMVTDSYDQTIFHYIAATTSSKSKISAARYYFEVLLGKMSETQPLSRLAQILDLEDANGDTPLLICARNCARKCVRVLVNYHADPHIANKYGRTPANYIAEMEESRKAGQLPLSSSSPLPTYAARRSPLLGDGVGSPIIPRRIAQPRLSEAAIQATQKVVPAMIEKLEALAVSYDCELQDKEGDINQAKQLQENVEKEMEACERAIEELTSEFGSEETLRGQIAAANELVEERAKKLRIIVEHGQARNLARLVETEESKLDLANCETKADESHQFLIEQLTELQSERRQLVDEIVALWSGAGVGEKMNDYRRLIAVSCNLRIEEVDGMLDDIASALSESANAA